MASPALSRPRPTTRAARTPRHDPAPRAAAPSTPERVTGRYRYDRATQAWWWSPEMFTMHGLPATSPPPATDEYLRYQHAEDRARIIVDQGVKGGMVKQRRLPRLRREEGRGRHGATVARPRRVGQRETTRRAPRASELDGPEVRAHPARPRLAAARSPPRGGFLMPP